VRLESVGKRYGLRQPWIVRGVTREVAAGRLIRLEGPNGSGKSTLLRVAAGVSVPSAGRVSGRPTAGYVPERFPGALAFPAREYLRHMARIHGLSGPDVAAAVEEWLDRLGASEYAAAPLRTLSKGMCQKVAIAQALLARPGLLVLDEAWTGLDLAARAALDMAVAERVADGGIVMFVDHDPARLAAEVNERWQLAGGRVTVVSGAGDAAAAGGDAAVAGVIIEVDGVPAGSVAEFGELAGVRSVRSAAASDGCELVRLTVTEADADDVLRRLLALDGAHIRSVAPEPVAPEAVAPEAVAPEAVAPEAVAPEAEGGQ
jgi:ABC-type multidrug transport system ATPase subunit